MQTEPSVTLALTTDSFNGHLPDAFVTDTSVRGRARSLRYRAMTGNQAPPLDEAKFWDARNVARMLGDLKKDSAILDCGAFNSAPIFWLADQGFTDLHGIDLNPNIVQQSRASRVHYSVQDIEATAFLPKSFDAVICSSVIEHGVSWPKFLAEVRRILKPGGLLYLSTDVVSEDIETSDVVAFGATWNPLGPDGLRWALDALAAEGFDVGALPDVEIPEDLPVEFAGRKLGFVAFLARLNTDEAR